MGDFGRNGWESTTDRLKQLVKDENLTLRQLALRATTPKSAFIGAPEQVADAMQDWFESGAVDGFMLSSSVLPDGFNDFIDLVLPILKERGLFRSEYESRHAAGEPGSAGSAEPLRRRRPRPAVACSQIGPGWVEKPIPAAIVRGNVLAHAFRNSRFGHLSGAAAPGPGVGLAVSGGALAVG